MALPGTYRVRLTVDGARHEASLTLRQDPRVTLSADALAAQLAAAQHLAALLTDSSRAWLTAQSEEAQLKALAPTGTVAQALRAYRSRLTLLAGSSGEKPAEPPEGEGQGEAAAQQETAQKPPLAPQGQEAPNLKDVEEHIAGLYTDVTRGDGAPTVAQLEATATVESELRPLLAEWSALQRELPALNRQLEAARLAPIRADLPPPRDVNLADEE